MFGSVPKKSSFAGVDSNQKMLSKFGVLVLNSLLWDLYLETRMLPMVKSTRAEN